MKDKIIGIIMITIPILIAIYVITLFWSDILAKILIFLLVALIIITVSVVMFIYGIEKLTKSKEKV